MWLVILAGTLAADALGGTGTFASVLACTASGLHVVEPWLRHPGLLMGTLGQV